jgi:Ca2+-binding EF-hand superfamily protein
MLRCSSSWVKGCCSTAIEERFNRIRDENLRRAEPLLRALMFPDNVWAKLWAIFITLDESGDDLISFSEFCEFFSLEKTNFAERSFLILDGGCAGALDFLSFILCAWNYCTYDKRGLAAFAFKLYDVEGHGKIAEDTMLKLVTDIYDISQDSASLADFGIDLRKNSNEYTVAKARRAIKEAVGLDGFMDVNEFITFSNKNPMILRSAYVIQLRLQIEILGVAFWKGMTRKRREAEFVANVRVNFLNIENLMSALRNANVLQPRRRSSRGNKRLSKLKNKQHKDVARNATLSARDKKALKEKYKLQLRLNREASNMLERSDSANVIQRVERGRQARKKLKRNKLQRHDSAKRIQAVQRGRSTRKRLPLEQKKIEKELRKQLKLNIDVAKNYRKGDNRNNSKRSSHSGRSNHRRTPDSKRSSARSIDTRNIFSVANGSQQLSSRSSGRSSSRSGTRSHPSSPFGSARSNSSRGSARDAGMRRDGGRSRRATYKVESRIMTRIDSVSTLITPPAGVNGFDEVPAHLRTDQYVYNKDHKT